MSELVQVFYEPGKVFDKVREKRIWIAAFVAMLVLTMALTAYLTNAIGYENIARHQIEDSSFTKNMTQEQKEQAIQGSLTPARKNMQYLFILIGVSIFMSVFALLFMAIAGISGGPIKFPQAFGTAVYTAWPFSVLNAIMSVLVVALSADKESLNPQSVVAMNIGAFLDKATTAKPLYALASSIDVMIIAQMIFAAYGLSVVAKVPFAKTILGMGGIWVIITLIRIGFSFVF